jgi:hypothetical protein
MINMKKESLKSRIIAESEYNELWQLQERKKEILAELKDINKKLSKYITVK